MVGTVLFMPQRTRAITHESAMHLTAISIVLGLMTATAQAQLLVVDPSGGGAYTSLQAAINAAPTGATVLVRGGSYGPIQINRSLTILASPLATITQPFFGSGNQPPAIQLNGTGVERVSLSNLYVSNVADGGNGWNTCGPAISSSGIAKLTVEECTLRGAYWTVLSGSGAGASGIFASGPASVVIVRSTIAASPSMTDAAVVPDGVPGVNAPNGTVVVMQSTVIGGSCGRSSIPGQTLAPCPCPGFPGTGGPGIRASTVVTSGGTVVGGLGSQYFIFGQQPWGSQPNGVPCDGCSPSDIPVTLTQAAPLRIGSTQILTFPPVGAVRFVASGSPALAPVALSPNAHVFLDLTAALSIQAVATATSQLSFAVPNQLSLLGVEVAHQGFSLQALGLSTTNPILGTIQP
jgi:hypothetical protein